jgi:hypothetical protein
MIYHRASKGICHGSQSRIAENGFSVTGWQNTVPTNARKGLADP